MERNDEILFDAWDWKLDSNKTGFNLPRDENSQSLDFEKWTSDIKKRVQANARATTTLWYRVTQEQLSKSGQFQSANEV